MLNHAREILPFGGYTRTRLETSARDVVDGASGLSVVQKNEFGVSGSGERQTCFSHVR